MGDRVDGIKREALIYGGAVKVPKEFMSLKMLWRMQKSDVEYRLVIYKASVKGDREMCLESGERGLGS